MESLEGYFDNLAAAAVNKKSVLEKLVVNNTKLAATNENLVVVVKKMTSNIKYLEREPPASRKAEKASGIRPCAHITRNDGIMHPRHATNLLKIKTSAPLVGKSCCEGVGQ